MSQSIKQKILESSIRILEDHEATLEELKDGGWLRAVIESTGGDADRTEKKQVEMIRDTRRIIELAHEMVD